MKEVKKIESSTCSRFNNALHAEFHQRMHSIVTSEDVALTHVDAALDQEWKAQIDLEVEINRRALASADTLEIAETDRQRDQTLSYIFATVDASRNSPIKAQRDNHPRLEIALRPYRGIAGEAHEQETAHIRGLLVDLRKADVKPLVTALALDDALVQLEEQNDAFVAASANRADTRAATTLEPSKTARPRTDALYQRACDLVYASQLMTTEAPALASLETLINRMNQTIAEFKTSHNQSMGQKRIDN